LGTTSRANCHHDGQGRFDHRRFDGQHRHAYQHRLAIRRAAGTLVRKFAHQRFEPSGFTKNPEIRNASSITDYVFRWLALQFIPGYREAVAGNRAQPELAMPGLLEEEKKRVNRPVRELQLAEDTDALE